MIKSNTKLGIIILATLLINVVGTGSEAATSLYGSNRAKVTKTGIKISFIDALINSITKGEGALKATCKTVWHSNEPTTFIEKSQCQKANKEIAMAKREYPQILATIDRFKYYTNSSSRSISNDMSALMELNRLAYKCKDQVAIRAAKTMEYWGTTKTGGWYYESLYEMGAERASQVLDSCKENSWLYQAINDISGSAVESWRSLQRFTISTPQRYCFNPPNANTWSPSLLDNTRRKLSELVDYSKIVNYFESNPATAAEVLPGNELQKLNLVSRNLKQEARNCSQVAQRGEQVLAIRAKEKRESEIRAAAAQRKRRAAAAAAAAQQRRAAAAAAARDAETKRQQQVRQKAIDAVTLE